MIGALQKTGYEVHGGGKAGKPGFFWTHANGDVQTDVSPTRGDAWLKAYQHMATDRPLQSSPAKEERDEYVYNDPSRAHSTTPVTIVRALPKRMLRIRMPDGTEKEVPSMFVQRRMTETITPQRQAELRAMGYAVNTTGQGFQWVKPNQGARTNSEQSRTVARDEKDAWRDLDNHVKKTAATAASQAAKPSGTSPTTPMQEQLSKPDGLTLERASKDVSRVLRGEKVVAVILRNMQNRWAVHDSEGNKRLAPWADSPRAALTAYEGQVS